MLRRFELYTFEPGAGQARRAALARAARRCGRFIPEVTHSATGQTISVSPGAAVDLVWEHAFDGPAAYRRYMVHPYHAAVLDRFLLVDSPERVVADDTTGAGLVGYRCDAPVFAMAGGVRRLVLLRVAPDANTGALERLEEALVGVGSDEPGVQLSVFAANTLGPAWFDGEHPVPGPPPRWTHLWELRFSTADALEAYRTGPSVAARIERVGWSESTTGAVRGALEVVYELELDSLGEPPGRSGTS